MTDTSAQQTYLLVYYTGTGGSALTAEYLAAELRRKGCLANVEAITAKAADNRTPYDTLILVFPVHAFNAPQPVYSWIKRQQAVDNVRAAVISVSGGGEISPNTASRLGAIKRLEKKGYRVVYENMIVLPSNIIISTPEPLATALVAALSRKAEQMAAALTANIRRRTKPLLFDRILSFLCELQKPFNKAFGKHLRVAESCNGCGKCAQGCLSGNITMVAGKPQFAATCHACLGCVYVCPLRALTPRYSKFMVIKEGYNLAAWQEKALAAEEIEPAETAKGYVWSGVKKYLTEQ